MKYELQAAELIIFDCDGVLVDSEVIFNQVLVEDLAARGHAMSVEESMRLFVGGSMESVKDAMRNRGLDLAEDWIELIYAKVKARLEEHVEPIPGVKTLVQKLTQANMAYCVASNGPVDKMHITLGKTGLLPYFEKAIFSAYEINHWKPDPALFLHAAQHFSVKPEKCVVIEDSQQGVLAAHRAQMPCLAFAPHGYDAALEKYGAKCFESMDDVFTMLSL